MSPSRREMPASRQVASMRRDGGIFALPLIFCVLLGALTTCFGAEAQNPIFAFDAANRLYDQGKYSEAANAFEQLLQSKVSSPAIYFNLGNSFFKSGQMGRAIAAYRAAEIVTPRDPDIRANLRFARNQVQGPTLVSTPWQNWLHKMTLNEWTGLLVAAFWLLLLLFAFLQWRPNLRRTLRTFAIGIAAACLFLGLCAALYYQDDCNRTAIVITRDAVVHASPFEGSPNAFTLGDGSEVRILDERKDQNQDWLKITTDPRRVGWVKKEQVLLAPTTLQKSKTI